ncbi:MAG TPA: penicillin acylase family protein [Burkholderiaceae bacterium]|nr:penicillin acylase family protein [Burkholderiaceae bacterium]
MRARYAGFAILLVFIALLAVLLWYRQASLPVHEGTFLVPGLQQPVRIDRDAYGIPNIVAANERDANFALGYTHAQDRLWQMEMNRRIAAGRLAEVLGEPALDTDKFLRTIGIARTAQSIYENLDAEHRDLLDAYAAGVNAYLSKRGGPLPPEFFLTRAPKPEPWTPADSIGWSLMMAWDLARYSYSRELRRLQLAQRFSVAEINDFYPPYPGDAAPATADYAELYRLLGLKSASVTAMVAPTFGLGDGEGLGSNNWVVSGRRTVSGKPMMANDPHLGLTTPSVWYFAGLQAPGLKVMGATLPGVPGVVLGRTDRVAWAFTNTGVDQQDLYLERINPEQPGEYQTPEGWAPFASRVERVRVKGGDDVELTIRETRHGPVISGLASVEKGMGQPKSGQPQFVLAMRWSALEPSDTTTAAIRALNKARNIDQAEQALEKFQIVTQSALIADLDGKIGMIVTGRIPMRDRTHDLLGLVPAPGWEARYDWRGYLPTEQAPRSRDPAGGMLVTANHKVVPSTYAHHLTYEWFLPYRAQRAEQLLQARGKHDVSTFKAIQADVTSLAARDIFAVLKDAQPQTEAGRDAIARLGAWDFQMKRDAPEPLIYHAWMRELKHRIFADDLGPLTDDYVDQAELTATLLHVLSGRAQARDWCDDRSTGERFETCLSLASGALDAAVTQLTKVSGRDVAGLRWGDAHRATAEHRPMSNVPGLRRLFDLSTAVPGDTHTINVGALSHRAEAPYSTRHTATLRAIYDLSALESNSVWMGSSGQAGNPFSDSYASMQSLWRDVQYLSMRPPPPREAVTLELKPMR